MITSEKPQMQGIMPFGSLPIRFELCQRRHVAEVMAIEQHSFGSQAWTEMQLCADLGRRSNIGLIATAYQRVVGYAVYSTKGGIFDIYNLAVHRDFRRLRVGSAIVREIQGYARASPKRKRIITIVRERNLPAQLFFRELGFKAVETFENFYDGLDEQAIQFQWKAGRQ